MSKEIPTKHQTMKTVQQWIDEYLSPEERERFVRNANDPKLKGGGVSWKCGSLFYAVAISFDWPLDEVKYWIDIAKRTEPYKPQRPIIGAPLCTCALMSVLLPCL